MLNINELESKWLRYKIKSFIPHFVILLSTLIIASILFFMDFDNLDLPVVENSVQVEKIVTIEKVDESNLTSLPRLVETTSTIKDIISQPIAQEAIKAPHTIQRSFIPLDKDKKVKLLIQPSLDFIRNMQENSPEYYNDYSKKIIYTPVKEVVKKKVPQKIVETKIQELVQDLQVEDGPQVEEEPQTKIKIQRQNTQDDIQHVVKRFKKSNNPALSLFIAKKYYSLGNYKQSYNYALITNELNNNIEDSWMVFAQSLYKMGKKEKAIKVLKKFVTSSHSSRAKILLDNIIAGKIK